MSLSRKHLSADVSGPTVKSLWMRRRTGEGGLIQTVDRTEKAAFLSGWDLSFSVKARPVSQGFGSYGRAV